MDARVSGVLLLLSATLPAQQGESSATAPLIVHEWGTFTSMQGSNGIGLEGLQHEEEGLPPFVHSLDQLDAAPGGVVSRGAVKFPARRVTQKMETPVIYFHTDVPRRVQVDVSFDRGLLTQFYPIPTVIRAPRLTPGTAIDVSQLGRTSARWSVDLLPYSESPPAEIPAVAVDDPWGYARQVRAAFVRTVAERGVGRPLEADHYIFYRGLGTFELPLRVEAAPGGQATFYNGSDARVPFAVAVEMTADGGRYLELGAVAAGAPVEIAWSGVTLREDTERVSRELGASVMRALVAAGLHLDEARAMVATWSRQWFRSCGTRVIYLLPRQLTDGVLPLRIQPCPDQLVRVLVGRMEYLTPEMEAAVESALRDRTAQGSGVARDAEAFLLSLDRFLEPHTRRALARTDDEVVRRSARHVLGRLGQ